MHVAIIIRAVKIGKMKTSFVATVLNEEETIELLLNSLLEQTQKPDEIIIVDGGSKDGTLSIVKKFKKVRLLRRKGNRAVGRNYGIQNAKHEIILVSDAGCILERNWVKNIASPFIKKNVNVVAGYYKAKTTTLFEKCLVPYVLVMSDKLDPKTFLPASRSLAFRKSAWKRVGKFPERFSHNEDYVFARSLAARGENFKFVQKAIVYWTPRKNISEAYEMFYRFAKGDSESRIFRPKVILVFLRYILWLALLALFLLTSLNFFAWILILSVIIYLVWAVKKNYHYVNDPRAVIILPVLQLTADASVIVGTIAGMRKY